MTLVQPRAVRNDEILRRIVPHIDESIARTCERALDRLITQRMRLGELLAAQGVRVNDVLEPWCDLQGANLVSLHMVRAVGDEPKLYRWGKMTERPGRVVEQYQTGFVVAISLDQASQIFGRVIGILAANAILNNAPRCPPSSRRVISAANPAIPNSASAQVLAAEKPESANCRSG